MLIIGLVMWVRTMQVTPACETIGPRMDGTYVTICSGKVTRVTDKAPEGSFTYLRPEGR